MSTNLDTEKIHAQREGGNKLGVILSDLLDLAKPGISLLTIEERSQEYIKSAGGTPSFQTVEGYSWSTCLCVNEDVVHGIPTDYILQEEDVLTIDVGMLYKGYHTDTAWTKVIRHPKTKVLPNNDIDTLLSVGEKTFWNAIAQAKVGNHIGHISQAIQEGIEGANFHVVKSLVGHTVGRELHEKPQVPGFVRGSIEKTPPLVPGMTLAIEVIYAQGSGDIMYANEDGWTLTTKDGSLSATFEHSILVTNDEPEVLTRANK
jgi:methionyl aminopeptidase